ncbi:MAG TPA: tetratricopeptide repeat protein, partial [Methanoculleus sp.]|nr:tetratricopeptide repeat protein [Methanoculleus sp.]
ERYEEAVECYDRVLEVNPDDTGALKGKAAALINLDQPVEATKCYRRLQRLQRG